MRWIDTSYLAASAVWYVDAHEKLRRAARFKSRRRKRYIRATSTIWASIKHHLEALSGATCWYCEGHYKAGAPNHVDHFRPKGKVVSLIDESVICDEGYWRLAFELDNYRLSCHRCNTAELDDDRKQGKANYFPIADETKRASGSRCSPSGLAGELPLLLDPLLSQDCKLLYFNEDGDVGAVPNASAGQADRVALSKRVYNLNRSELADERRRLLEQCRTCVKNLDDALAFLSMSATAPEENTRRWGELRDRNAKALRQLIRGPHRTAIICYLQARTEPWLADWLSQELTQAKSPPVLRLTHADGEACGRATPDGLFVVLRGSIALRLPTRARRGPGALLKATLCAAQVLSKDGKSLLFNRNVIFASELEALNCILNDPPMPYATNWA